ncbi:Outer membrane receptor for ferrienterochelin and colicins [Raoultella terrigena]|uniref:Outer membrane receptor for ferrienterochelin and colicins n=1 Tax=Raoultella terrigena TaxID=577 RepID=A0A4V6J1S1_RAOTE|nr:Outer membrane receptor for ferrienterochelin and colicins [Raoultella terrigena]
MKAIVGGRLGRPAKVYGTALTATFVKGKRASTTNRESYTNTGSAITDSTSEYMRVPGYGMLDWTAYWQVAKNVRLNGGVYNITDRKYWDYLSSRNIETSTNQDANDKALADDAWPYLAAGRERRFLINPIIRNLPPAAMPGILIVEKDVNYARRSTSTCPAVAALSDH